MRLRHPALGAFGAAAVAATAFAATPLSTSAQSASCPEAKAAVTNVEYVVFAPDGSSHNYTTLRGHLRHGDQVNVLFSVPALPAGCSDVQLSVASYDGSSRHSRHAKLFSSDTGTFIAGGGYEMSANVAPKVDDGPNFFSFYFVSGPVVTPPRYRDDVIGWTDN